MSGYNGLNRVKVDLAQAGICRVCGYRLSDPACTHATPEQIEYTKRLDAEIDASYAKKVPTYDQLMAGATLTEEQRTQLHAEYNARFTYPITSKYKF